MATLHEIIESLAFCCKGLCEYCAFEDEHKNGNPCDIALMCEAENHLKEYEQKQTQLQDMMDRYDNAVKRYEEAIRNCDAAEAKYQLMVSDWYDANRELLAKAEKEDKPFTWDELLTMKGKPVWMVLPEESKWIIVLNVGKFMDGKGALSDEHDFYMKDDMGKKWIAYRKECDYVKRS